MLRADLERLGRYDQTRVRQRFRDAFEPAYTRIIVVDAADVGSVALRPDGEASWLEHLYIDASHQGRGVGSQVLAMILDDDGLYRLNVLQGSPARSLYERHGFVVDSPGRRGRVHDARADGPGGRAPATAAKLMR